MDLNATLLGQMITFAIFVWFTMRVIWPLLTAQLDARKKIIADGLAAAEEGRKILATAEEAAKNKIHDAKLHCYKLLEDADQQATLMLENSREAARQEREDIVASAQVAIDRAVIKAKHDLQLQVTDLAMLGAEKILQRSINPQDHEKILQELAKSLV
jgi:F-type H+-transporting ATPase subunit b